MSRGKGTPRAKALPKGGRKPRTAVNDLSTERTPRREFTPSDPDGKLVVLFSRVDLDSEWCLTKINAADHRGLLDRIRSVESMTVHQVFNTELGKEYDITALPNSDARDRLEVLKLDDRDRIGRLRITGEQRLYGFREGSRFYALWWDPHHQIWPSKKRHT